MEPVSWHMLTEDPTKSVAALVGLLSVSAAAAYGIRVYTRRSRSLRGQVLALTLSALAVGFLAAVLLAQLMVIDSAQLGRVAAVLLVTAVVATVLVVLATMSLARDVQRLEDTVRKVESGDREIRTGVVRSDELGHVARALDELTSRLGQLESERAAMFSSVSHDLRTPLAALRAAVEALADGVAPDPDRYLRSMQRDIDALAALVDDVFLLASIEAGRVDHVRVTTDLSEVTDEAIEALTPVAEAADVRLVLDATSAVRVAGNPTALGRVVRNLVDNAIRHAPEGSTVHVAVEDDGLPTVRVVDEGSGFAPDFADSAFDTFTRADPSRTRATGGAGLGLAIARGLVESHGGRIWIEEAPGGHVAFELPVLS